MVLWVVRQGRPHILDLTLLPSMAAALEDEACSLLCGAVLLCARIDRVWFPAFKISLLSFSPPNLGVG